MTAVAKPRRRRHPVLRTGEREPIGPYKRRLIYERDGYHCQQCDLAVAPSFAYAGQFLQLDHIIPWSAYGSDRSDNLRTLCVSCNEARSNFVDDDPPRVVGVARACFWCAQRREELPYGYEGVDPAELGRVKAYCGCCGTTSWVPDESWIL